MTQAMMPPPLPGYPAGAPQAVGVPGYPAGALPVPVPVAMPAPAYPPPAAAAAPFPQGYPGPAVHAPPPAPGQPFPAYAQPAPAPAPQAYAAPPAPAPAPQYAPQPQAYAPQAPQPQYAPQQGYGGQQPQQPVIYRQPHDPGDIGAAIANATGGDRAPIPGPGSYRFEVLETICTVHPQEGKLTCKAKLRVLASDNPNHPVGSEVAYVEGLAYENGAKRWQDFLIITQGYPNRNAYDQAMTGYGFVSAEELRLLLNASGNPITQQQGNKYPANPAKGRQFGAVVSQVTKIAGPKSKKAGQQVTYTNWLFSL